MTLSDSYRKHITSPQNPRYKSWKKHLENASAPDCPWLGIEGKKQVLEISAHRQPEILLLSTSFDVTEIKDILENCREVYILPPRLLSRLSGVDHDQGIISFMKKPAWARKDLTDKVLVLEGLQDPGNLGTILRTASALGGFSVITLGNTVSFYNRKVVRASAGYLFLVPFLQGVTVSDLRELGYQIWYSSPSDGTKVREADFHSPLAVVFGSEGQGLAGGDGESGKRITIPMVSGRDSLNVAVAASLVMYEINRGAPE